MVEEKKKGSSFWKNFKLTEEVEEQTVEKEIDQSPEAQLMPSTANNVSSIVADEDLVQRLKNQINDKAKVVIEFLRKVEEMKPVIADEGQRFIAVDLSRDDIDCNTLLNGIEKQKEALAQEKKDFSSTIADKLKDIEEKETQIKKIDDEIAALTAKKNALAEDARKGKQSVENAQAKFAGAEAVITVELDALTQKVKKYLKKEAK